MSAIDSNILSEKNDVFHGRRNILSERKCFLCTKIFDQKNIGSRSRSWTRILKVSVSEGVVSVSDDEVSVSVLDDEAETPSLVHTIGDLL